MTYKIHLCKEINQRQIKQYGIGQLLIIAAAS